MSSVEPKPEPEVEKPVEEKELPPPPPPEEEPPAEPPPPKEDVWKEDYDELVKPEKPSKPKKKRRWGGVIVLVIVVLALVIWTVLSPKVLPAQGETYVRSPTYASLGDFTGYRDIWAGNTSWGVSIGGPSDGSVNQEMRFKVLITKISEKPGNWFLQGTAIDLRNVSIHLKDGTFLGAMSNHSNPGFGVLATVPVTFTSPGSYDLYVHAKFLTLEVMRIGFIPLEMVNVPEVDFGVSIEIS